MGFIHKHCVINVLCLVGMRAENGERKDEICEKVVKMGKVELFIKRINQENDLARTAKESRRYFGKSAVAWWRIGDEEMVEWSKWKGDNLHNMAERYEEVAAKASNHFLRSPISRNYYWRRL